MGESGTEMTAEGAGGFHAVVVRARDLEGLVRFYEAIGLRQVRRTANVVQFDAGGGSLFEVGKLAPGADPIPVLETRLQSHMAPILRVDDLDARIERVEASGGTKLDTLPLPTAMLIYVADPEGNVIGLRQAAPEPPPNAEPVDGGSGLIGFDGRSIERTSRNGGAQ